MQGEHPVAEDPASPQDAPVRVVPFGPDPNVDGGRIGAHWPHQWSFST